MNKQDVISFFDHLAPSWDAELIKDDAVIGKILDNAGVTPGKDVLDVACGTGVLFPFYFARQPGSLTAIDISSEMVKIARSKFEGRGVEILCGDVEEVDFGRQFDCIVVYNAFPHFPEPERLIACLASLLRSGGTLTVAHGMSREEIDHHHEGAAKHVSHGLMHEDALAAIFAQHLTVTTKCSDEHMYQVVGKKA